MNFDDLHFSATDCCAQHTKAQVVHGDVVTTVSVVEEGVFALTVTDSRGLVERRSGLTQADVAAAIVLL